MTEQLKQGDCCKEKCLATKSYHRDGFYYVVMFCVNKGCGFERLIKKEQREG